MNEFEHRPRRERFNAELEAHKKSKAYYQSIRRPMRDGFTFALALVASILCGLRILGAWIIDYGDWLTLFYFFSFAAFVGLDSLVAKAHHRLPNPLGGFDPSRIYEKFAMQERAWQLLVVLMIPPTAWMWMVIRYLSQRM